MTMLVGYFDDSGRRDGPNPIAVVGGFVAHPQEWLGFNHRWSKILKKYGVEMHHHNKWSNRAPQFNDPQEWPLDRLQAYMNELLDLITGLNAFSVAAAVPEDRFDANFPKGRKYTSPFGFAAQLVFAVAIEKARQFVPDARIAYVFESGTQGYGEVQRSFRQCASKPEIKDEFGLISLAEADKRQIMQLQAADVMAYEVFKLFEKGDDRDSWNPRYPLRTIGDRMPGLWTTPSVDIVRESAEIRDVAEALDELIELRKRFSLP